MTSFNQHSYLVEFFEIVFKIQLIATIGGGVVVPRPHILVPCSATNSLAWASLDNRFTW